MMKQQR